MLWTGIGFEHWMLRNLNNIRHNSVSRSALENMGGGESKPAVCEVSLDKIIILVLNFAVNGN